MNFTYLKYFVDTFNENSVQKAASVNFVSQPAISQGIRKLENELDLELLEHKKNRLKITKDGIALKEASTQLFASIKTFHNDINKIKTTVCGKLTIGISNSLVSPILKPMIKSFSKKYPEVKLEIKVGKTSNLKKMLEKDIIDLAISVDNGELFDLHSIVIKKGKFILIKTKDAGSRLLTTEMRPEVRKLFKEIKRKSDVSFEEAIQIESWTSIYDLVSAGFGYGLVPDFMILKNSNLKVDESFTQDSFKIVGTVKKENKSEALTQAFISLLLKH